MVTNTKWQFFYKCRKNCSNGNVFSFLWCFLKRHSSLFNNSKRPFCAILCMQMIKIVKMISSFLGLLNIVGKMIEKEDKDGDYDLSDKFIPFLYSQKSKFCKGSKPDIILHFPLPYLYILFILFKDSYHYKLITSSPEIFHIFFLSNKALLFPYFLMYNSFNFY